MERIIQIITHVIEEILRHESIRSRKDLERELLQLGYQSDDINTAFQSLYTVSLLLTESAEEAIGEICDIKQGQRIFSLEEQQKFSLSFQREILRLKSSALLNMAEIEQLLFEAMQMDKAEVGVRELELILHKVVKEEERLLLMLPYKTEPAVAFFLN
jgi:uncharacterized protein Smg (DUF494 family)